MYWIDPDGHGTGDAPIYVSCNMTTGSTLIPHDSEEATDVGQCWDAGCYSRPIQYNATMRQMIALLELSSDCTQSVQYDCKIAPMEFNGESQSWWTDRHGVRHNDFTGGNSTQSKCQCALDNSCLDRKLQCNCNALSPIETTDTGLIMDKSSLPITRLNFGRILAPPSSGRYILGRLECHGLQMISSVKRLPTSCQDVWRTGYTTSGLYSILRSEISETVFCDMTQVPGEEKALSSFVSTEQFNLITERLNKADERIQRQAMRIRNSVVRLNLFLGRQDRTNSLQIRKLESIDEKLARDLRELFNGHQRQNEEIAELRRRSDRPAGKSLTRMPANCHDLKTMGHALSGIYPVKGDDNIDMVYCNMTSGAPRETWIGKADVASSLVYFYVLRKSPFYLEGRGNVQSILPFEITRSNQGGGMDAKKGVFTVPKSGTYVFRFSFGAIKREKPQHVSVTLVLNDVEDVASIYGSDHQGFFSLSLQSILNLRRKDKIHLVLQSASGGGNYEDIDMTTHFSGFLLDEQLF
ncbi:uncharacterized protein LOC124339558 isoform X2 [Daphnia pulicaria]|uniref:uncharacterized protein LOC124339558 isoform X2 n=1 Tax=Daphnia pulicaria TaxID=35523 RepID=UPI001EEB03E0|nr:uncharacterized protein LOC124339558 isoform X2 [Daphnia pulicaria]